MKDSHQRFQVIFHLIPPFRTSANLLGEQQDICGHGVELVDDILECQIAVGEACVTMAVSLAPRALLRIMIYD
jgi:hypothetical protein